MNYSAKILILFCVLAFVFGLSTWIDYRQAEITVETMENDDIFWSGDYYGESLNFDGGTANLLVLNPKQIIPQLLSALEDSSKYKAAHFILRTMCYEDVDRIQKELLGISNRPYKLYLNDRPVNQEVHKLDVDDHNEVQTWWNNNLQIAVKPLDAPSNAEECPVLAKAK